MDSSYFLLTCDMSLYFNYNEVVYDLEMGHLRVNANEIWDYLRGFWG